MNLNTLIFLLFLIAAVLFAVLIFLFTGADLCFPIHGIDHNGKNEPFTIFLGAC